MTTRAAGFVPSTRLLWGYSFVFSVVSPAASRAVSCEGHRAAAAEPSPGPARRPRDRIYSSILCLSQRPGGALFYSPDGWRRGAGRKAIAKIVRGWRTRPAAYREDIKRAAVRDYSHTAAPGKVQSTHAGQPDIHRFFRRNLELPTLLRYKNRV